MQEQKGKTNKCYRQVLLILPPTPVKAMLTEYHLGIALNRENRTRLSSFKYLLHSFNLLLTRLSLLLQLVFLSCASLVKYPY